MIQSINLYNSTYELMDRAYIAADIMERYLKAGKLAAQDLDEFVKKNGINLDVQPKSVL